MLIPTGKLEKSVTPAELQKILSKKKIKNGYFKGLFVSTFGRFESIVVFKDKTPVLAELKELNTCKVWKGLEALKLTYSVLADVMRGNVTVRSEKSGVNNVKIYKLKGKVVDQLIKLNRECVVSVEAEPKLDGYEGDRRTLARYERIVNLLGGVESANLEDYLKGVSKDFTGIVYARSTDEEDYYAEIYVIKGEIAGARVRIGGREYKGNSALYYLDRDCEISTKCLLTLSVPDAFKVAKDDGLLDKVEVIVDERLDSLIEQIKSVKIRSKGD